jgi:hypothetical protein
MNPTPPPVVVGRWWLGGFVALALSGADLMANADATNPDLIEVIEAVGEWFVRVVEDGSEQTRSFELESYALAFAEGQRLRLHLDKFVRL